MLNIAKTIQVNSCNVNGKSLRQLTSDIRIRLELSKTPTTVYKLYSIFVLNYRMKPLFPLYKLCNMYVVRDVDY